MAPKYKLYYFNVKALAEPIRLLFHYAKVDFEDVRITQEEWATLKPTMPWNVMPVLEEDGKQLSQSGTILRYLGRKFGLIPADEFQAAKCSEYVDAVMDVRVEVVKFFKEQDESKKAEIKKNLQENTFPKVWKKLNTILKENGTGFLVGNKITYADIYVGFMTEYLPEFMELSGKMGSDYPDLVSHQKKILASPGIKEWIEKRPATQF